MKSHVRCIRCSKKTNDVCEITIQSRDDITGLEAEKFYVCRDCAYSIKRNIEEYGEAKVSGSFCETHSNPEDYKNVQSVYNMDNKFSTACKSDFDYGIGVYASDRGTNS